jgi:hypothetical protein
VLKAGVKPVAVGVGKAGVTVGVTMEGVGELIVKLIVPAVTVSNTP